MAGRWLADRAGRCLTGALAMAAVALFAALAYTGSAAALLAGYILGVFAGSVFAPAAGSLVNEPFPAPAPARASVAGWSLAAGVLGAVTGLVVFGAVAGAGNRFAVAGLVTFLPAALATTLFGCSPKPAGASRRTCGPARLRASRTPGTYTTPASSTATCRQPADWQTARATKADTAGSLRPGRGHLPQMNGQVEPPAGKLDDLVIGPASDRIRLGSAWRLAPDRIADAG